jgi:acetyltransferase
MPIDLPAQRYPAELVEEWRTRKGVMATIRPIRPEDAGIEQEFVRAQSSETRFHRFFSTLKELSPEQLIRFTQIDFSREMALIAVHFDAGRETQIAVARYVTNEDGRSCEFAVVVADNWLRHGLATKLVQKLIGCAAAAGLKIIEGDVLVENHAMLALVKRLGFSVRSSPGDATLRHVSLALPVLPHIGG